MNVLRWGGLILLTVSSVAAQAQDLDPATKAKVENEIRRVMRETGVPSAQVGVARGGKVVYAAAFGEARIAYEGKPSIPATAEMHYAVGSISKQFTAACVLLLQEQGKLKLDDPVGKWFPNLTRANDVTLRMLLTHTSGYSDYAPQDYTIPEWTHTAKPVEVVRKWAGKPLDFEPGTKWQYSNTNFVLAGLIVEKVAGMPFRDFLRENVLTPLKLQEVLDLDYDRAKMEPTGYKRNALGPLRPAIPEAPGWYFADGELSMPVRTLMEWDLSLLNRTLLKPASYDEMFAEQKLKDGTGSHYALGQQTDTRNGRLVLHHSGEIGGFVAQNFWYPKEGVAIGVLTNQDASSAAGLITAAVSQILLPPASASAAAVSDPKATVRGILEAFQKGDIDRSLFTSNANFYFSPQAVGDYRTSLAPLGAIQSLTETRTLLRGGMQMRVYTVVYATKSVSISTYWMPDGKIEQFLLEGQ
ncbi:beta-lactamase [Terriglobus saanensis SP1PR4]|uniref:Beta-lactamase n=2 Tax=Terriglobus saanensis TaxID=870903 RepID=E8V222_TERSS|nr:beta-lactamase [Terriglobus saanensis SP1PR4]